MRLINFRRVLVVRKGALSALLVAPNGSSDD